MSFVAEKVLDQQALWLPRNGVVKSRKITLGIAKMVVTLVIGFFFMIYIPLTFHEVSASSLLLGTARE